MHRTINTTPIIASEESSPRIFNLLQFKNRSSKTRSLNFKIGDNVRIAYVKETFDENVNSIKNIKKNLKKPLYILEDPDGNLIKRKFYDYELQKTDGHIYRIEKILKTRTRCNKTEYFVKWINFPSTHNSWVDEIF